MFVAHQVVDIESEIALLGKEIAQGMGSIGVGSQRQYRFEIFQVIRNQLWFLARGKSRFDGMLV